MTSDEIKTKGLLRLVTRHSSLFLESAPAGRRLSTRRDVRLIKKLEALFRLVSGRATLRSGRESEVSMTRQVDGKSGEIGFRFLDEHAERAVWRVLRRVRRAPRAARGLFKRRVRLEALTRFLGLTARSPKSRTTFDNGTRRAVGFCS